MKATGLRRKIALVVMVPLIVGIFLTIFSALLPLYFFYSNMLETYTDNLIVKQKETLLNNSNLLADIASLNYIQKMLNALNVAGDLIEIKLFYGLRINQGLNYSSLSINAIEYNATNPHPTIYNLSMWAYQNTTNVSLLAQPELANYNSSGIFNSLITPVMSLGRKIMFDQFKQSYLIYDNDGFFYTQPAQSFLFNNSGINNITCSYYNSSVGNYYEPRCRPYYNIVATAQTYQAVPISPYSFANGQERGISLCRAQWNYTNSNLVLMHCVDLNIDNTFVMNDEFFGSKHSYSYILSTSQSIISYSKLSQTELLKYPDIFMLEFNSERSSEAKEYNKTIIPLFENQRTTTGHYEKDGDRMIIAVAPIMMILSTDGSPEHLGSVGVVMKRKYFAEKFDDLANYCTTILYIGFGISLGFLLLISAFCVYLTIIITKSVVQPIDHLVKILQRMKEGDLDIDILAAYEPSPPEISCLYEVFDKLRVVLRFNKILDINLTQAALVYSQALHLFTSFGNEKAMEICYRWLGFICYKKEIWIESAEYLCRALELAEKSGTQSRVELAKRKVETAVSMAKAKIEVKKALRFLDEAFDTLQEQNVSSEIIIFYLNIAEIFYENKVADARYIKDLKSQIEICWSPIQHIIKQRFCYIQGLFQLNCGRIKEAFSSFVSVIEDYPAYLPAIRDKAILCLQEISTNYLDCCQIFPEIQSSAAPKHKDIVLITSDSLTSGPISWEIPEFLKSLLDPNDRLALLQFSSSPNLVFNLTKMPMKIFSFDKYENSEKAVLYDSVIQGVKQLSLNKIYNCSDEERIEWMIVITDTDDRGSKASFAEVLEIVKGNYFNLIIVNMKANKPFKEFDTLADASRLGTVFNVKYEEQAKIIFKEIEAYMCPHKEVFFMNE